ncbi:MAG: adenosylmethionine decarboxylase, partial [Candidatus Hodarchaeota archaeon]
WRCDVSKEVLNDVNTMKGLFLEAIKRCNTEIIKTDFHEFSPEGITLIAILADSHAVLHSWPEEKFVMVEIFTCGERSEPYLGVAYLLNEFKPRYHERKQDFINI